MAHTKDTTVYKGQTLQETLFYSTVLVIKKECQGQVKGKSPLSVLAGDCIKQAKMMPEKT